MSPEEMAAEYRVRQIREEGACTKDEEFAYLCGYRKALEKSQPAMPSEAAFEAWARGHFGDNAFDVNMAMKEPLPDFKLAVMAFVAGQKSQLQPSAIAMPSEEEWAAAGKAYADNLRSKMDRDEDQYRDAWFSGLETGWVNAGFALKSQLPPAPKSNFGDACPHGKDYVDDSGIAFGCRECVREQMKPKYLTKKPARCPHGVESKEECWICAPARPVLNVGPHPERIRALDEAKIAIELYRGREIFDGQPQRDPIGTIHSALEGLKAVPFLEWPSIKSGAFEAARKKAEALPASTLRSIPKDEILKVREFVTRFLYVDALAILDAWIERL